MANNNFPTLPDGSLDPSQIGAPGYDWSLFSPAGQMPPRESLRTDFPTLPDGSLDPSQIGAPGFDWALYSPAGMPPGGYANAPKPTDAAGPAPYNPTGVNWDAYRQYARQAVRGINSMPFVFSDQAMSPRGSLWAGLDAAGTGPNPNALWNGPETAGGVPNAAAIKQFIFPGAAAAAPATGTSTDTNALTQALLGILNQNMPTLLSKFTPS